MKYRFRYIALLLPLIMVLFQGCNDDGPDVPVAVKMVDNFYLPSPLETYIGQSIAVAGEGFQTGDILHFSAYSAEHAVPLTDVDANGCSFVIPESFVSNSYTLTLKRGNNFQILGSIRIILKIIRDVPDRENSTIKGMVYCGSTPIAGVLVTDGTLTTLTDIDGCYWLDSGKEDGFVYITIPSGYEPYDNTGSVFPPIWQPLVSGPQVCEQHDFELTQVDNSNHIMLAGTDLHLANRTTVTDDLTQFSNGFISDVGQFVYNNRTTRVYTMLLGDITWDQFWYANEYDLNDYRNTMETYYPTLIFNVMGNHDNDPYMTGDAGGEEAFKNIFGPTYYSMNIGSIHYVVLDNTVWVNTGGSEGVLGSRNYTRHITDRQMTWLQQDLAAITDKNTPVIVGFHCNSHSNYNSTFSNNESYTSSSTAILLSYLSAFNEVHILSGHSHYTANMILSDRIMQHNTAAVCETWWWSGKLSDVSICKDGTPAGYGVYEVDGTDISWYYKSIGKNRSKQFRSYGMNVVKEFFNQTNVQEQLVKYTDRNGEGNDYILVGEDIVYLNVWNYDPEWTITVTENGVELPVTRICDRDPMHTLCFDYPRVNYDNNANTDFSSNKNSHMFKIQTGSPSTTLLITVTDRFGNVYEETMTRPKSYTITSE